MVAQVDSANRRLTYSLENRANAVEALLHELRSDVLRIWVPLIVSACVLIGLFAGMGIQSWRDSSPAAAANPTPAAVQHILVPETEKSGGAVGDPKQKHLGHGKAKTGSEQEQ